MSNSIVHLSWAVSLSEEKKKEILDRFFAIPRIREMLTRRQDIHSDDTTQKPIDYREHANVYLYNSRRIDRDKYTQQYLLSLPNISSYFFLVAENEYNELEILDTEVDVPYSDSLISSPENKITHESFFTQLLSQHVNISEFFNSPGIISKFKCTLNQYLEFPDVKEYIDTHSQFDSSAGYIYIKNDNNKQITIREELHEYLIKTIFKNQFLELRNTLGNDTSEVELNDYTEYGWSIISWDDHKSSTFLRLLHISQRIPELDSKTIYPRQQAIRNALIDEIQINILGVTFDSLDGSEIERYFRNANNMLNSLQYSGCITLLFSKKDEKLLKKIFNHFYNFVPHGVFDEKKKLAIDQLTHSGILQKLYELISLFHDPNISFSKLSWQETPIMEDLSGWMVRWRTSHDSDNWLYKVITNINNKGFIYGSGSYKNETDALKDYKDVLNIGYDIHFLGTKRSFDQHTLQPLYKVTDEILSKISWQNVEVGDLTGWLVCIKLTSINKDVLYYAVIKDIEKNYHYTNYWGSWCSSESEAIARFKEHPDVHFPANGRADSYVITDDGTAQIIPIRKIELDDLSTEKLSWKEVPTTPNELLGWMIKDVKDNDYGVVLHVSLSDDKAYPFYSKYFIRDSNDPDRHKPVLWAIWRPSEQGALNAFKESDDNTSILYEAQYVKMDGSNRLQPLYKVTKNIS